MQMAGTSQTREAVRSADQKSPTTLPRDPSWGRVLATTISLWTARRVPRLRRPRLALSLVLGMLVAAAKSSFDAQRQGVAQLAANAVVLDRFLSYYGEEARPTRELLRESVADMLRRAWPGDDPADGRPAAGSRTEGRYDQLYLQTLALQPKTAAQRAFQAQALKVVGDTGQMRWLLFSQERGSTIPVPFLTVLVAWLVLLLVTFGLLAPGNATALLSLAVCSLSVASAIFLILDLDHPFEGIIRISGEPLRVALEQLGR